MHLLLKNNPLRRVFFFLVLVYNNGMKRIQTIHTAKGYQFLLNDVMLGEGEYDGGKFLLIESDDLTEHDNGMLAMLYLNKKHNPDFYKQPVKPFNDIQKVDVNKFKKHPALAEVTMEVMFAK